MKALRNLTSIMLSNRLDVIESSKEDAAMQLFNGINRGVFSTQKEAEEMLFPDANHKGVYYRRARRKLLTRLVNSFLAINEESNSNKYNKAFVDISKKLTAAKILISKGKRNTATLIAEDAIKVAMKYHFTEIVVELAEIIRDFYAVSGIYNKYKVYKEILEEYRTIRALEDLVVDYHRELETRLLKSKNPEKKTIELSKTYAEEARRLSLNHNSFKLNYFTHSIYAIYYQIIKDYDSLKKNSEKALAYFQSLPFDSNLPKRAFLSFLIPILIMEGQFEEANEKIEDCLKDTAKGGRNWIAFNQYKIINAFYAGDYQTGYEVMQLIRQYPLYKKLEEEFRIYEAFLHFFALTGRIKGHKKAFRLGKFLNETPIQGKDKKGMNVNILILQILFLLHDKKWGAIIDRMEPLQSYRYRYLHNDSSTDRSNQFLKLLQLLPKHSFVLEPIEKDAAPILEQLHSTPSNLMNHLDMEIVPYTVIWKMIRELLI